MINNVDVVCGLAWGDEAKGKIVSSLLQKNKYDWVCRWSGSHNAGHTIYFEGVKFVTHLIPAGVFYGINSFIGPDCLVSVDELVKELEYLKQAGIDTSTVFVANNAHVISSSHVEDDISKYKKTQGSTGKGVAPCARDKYARLGQQIKSLDEDELCRLTFYNPNIIKDVFDLDGDILCEGAQGNWLDINHGNYPYVTSANTLPYSACSLGFSPRKFRDIYGAAKIYDTRVGVDPEFSDDLLENKNLTRIAELGAEFGATTGRTRKVNWLNLDKLIKSINISGCNKVIISKIDILIELNKFCLIHNNDLIEFKNIDNMSEFIDKKIREGCPDYQEIFFSNNPYNF